jgi:hypothetical protein
MYAGLREVHGMIWGSIITRQNGRVRTGRMGPVHFSISESRRRDGLTRPYPETAVFFDGRPVRCAGSSPNSSADLFRAAQKKKKGKPNNIQF